MSSNIQQDTIYGQRFVRKRPLFHAPSMSSEAGSADKHSVGQTSILSRKSTIAGLSRRSFAVSDIADSQRPEGKWLSVREYLLILIEAFLSLTTYVIRERNLRPDELRRVNLTSRQAEIYMLYAEGYSSLLSLAIGVLADSYFRHYTMALFSVILHFAAICLVFMEDTIKGTQKGNPYADLVRNACTISLILIKASDFTRFVYAVMGITNRRRSTVFIFIFLHFWVSSYATYGGVIQNGFSVLFNYYKVSGSIVAFIATGISLYLFVYVLDPEVPKKTNYGLGGRVVGCLLLASYYKVFKVKKYGKKGFFGRTEGTFDKTTISRTKEILLLYVFLLPSIGIVFFTELKGNLFYSSVADKVKTDGFMQLVGLRQFARAIMCITMLVSYFGLWPLLALTGLKKKPTVKFLVGHLLALVTLFYAAIVMRAMLVPQFSGHSGYTRVYNTRANPVYFEPQDRAFTTHNFSVDSKTGIMVAYPCSKGYPGADTLFATRVYFNGTMNNFTMFLAVRCDHTLGYLILDPPEIVRIRGPVLPVREGPPGTNNSIWPRVYMYSSADTLQGTSVLVGKEVGYDHGDGHKHDCSIDFEKKTVREDIIEAGKMTTITLEPGLYHFKIDQTDIEKVALLEEGGVYGLMIYATTSSRLMEIDTVVPPNSASWWAYLVLFAINGFAAGLAYPTWRAIILSISPHGLPAMPFSFIAFLEGVSMWVTYIGFTTWHYYVSSYTMLAYSFGVTLFFFLCIFFFLKFWKVYQGMVPSSLS